MTPGEQLQEFEGVYVAHWEIARFEVTVGRSFLGRQAIEKWYPRFPHDFELPDSPGSIAGRGANTPCASVVVSARRGVSDIWAYAVVSWT
jgi:hypothetical protein